MANKKWTREETILAFELYCRIPFGKINKTNLEIIELAKLLDRTPSAVAMKMCNLASYDPVLRKRGIKGLINGSKLEKKIWEEFKNDWESLVFESKTIVEHINYRNKRDSIKIESNALGNERESIVKKRIGQEFFRSAVLNAYENCCCITGISIKQLLIASHIKPWRCSDVKTERINPSNGLCLNALHDKAFDGGFITIDSKYRVIISSQLKNEQIDELTKAWITSFDSKYINLPNKFLPEKRFIEYHNDVIFKH